MIESLQISFRPSNQRVITGGESIAFSNLYDNLPAAVFKGVYTHIDNEISELAKKLKAQVENSSIKISAHVTVLPNSFELLSHQQLSDNIAATKLKVTLYSLLTGKHPQESFDAITDKETRDQVQKLIDRAKADPDLHELAESLIGQYLLIMAACVCNHAFIGALGHGNPDHLQETLGFDFPTQTATAFMIANILSNGHFNSEFLKFAVEAGLLNNVGLLALDEEERVTLRTETQEDSGYDLTEAPGLR